MKKIFGAALLFLCALSAGCAGTYKQKLDFNPLEPLRVAVLPFAEVDSKGNFVQTNGALLIDKVPGVSQDLGQNPRAILRKIVQSELDSTALDMLAPSLVNAKLMHSGFADEKLNFDYQRIFATSAN